MDDTCASKTTVLGKSYDLLGSFLRTYSCSNYLVNMIITCAKKSVTFLTKLIISEAGLSAVFPVQWWTDPVWVSGLCLRTLLHV